MGGYRRPLLKLRFVGQEFDGLVVRCRRPTIDDHLAMDQLDSLRIDADSTPDAVDEAIDRAYAVIVGLIREWNLEDEDGQPVPRTTAGLRAQDAVFVAAIVHAIREASTGVPSPLPGGSPNGEPAPEVSLPMDPLPDPPPNSSAPD